MSRPTFGASKVLKLRNFRNSETPKGRNFETSETRKRAKNGSGSWRIPSAAARKGALGGRSARNPRTFASGLRKLALSKRDRPKSRKMSRPTFGASKVLKLQNFRNFETSETLTSKLRKAETSKPGNLQKTTREMGEPQAQRPKKAHSAADPTGIAKTAHPDSGNWIIPSATGRNRDRLSELRKS